MANRVGFCLMGWVLRGFSEDVKGFFDCNGAGFLYVKSPWIEVIKLIYSEMSNGLLLQIRG